MKTQNALVKTFTVFSLAIIMISCEQPMFGIRGEGPVVSQELFVDEFSGVDLVGAFDVVIEYGAEQKIIVEGQQNIIDRLQTGVNGDIWEIKLHPALYRNYELTVYITSPHIDKIHLSGSGKIETEGFENIVNLDVRLMGSGSIKSTSYFEVADRSRVDITGSGDIDLFVKTKRLISEITGSGDIYLSGVAEESVLNIEGSGNCDAFSMLAESCQVSIFSSGNAYVSVNEMLDATITGSGNIRYKGSPTVDASIFGSGNIRKTN